MLQSLSPFNKTYELSLNRYYVSHWGLLEAVRELLQNSLDSESPFVYEFVNREDDTTTLLLNSEFTVLSPTTLLLGSTSKSDATDSIGSFGEGYKIALLVLTRLGNEVNIANGDKLWKPRFKHNNKFNEELLVIEESPAALKNKGLTFEINGLSEDDVTGIINSCLQMQRNIGEKKSTKYGDILIDRKGMLYVGGLFICETQLDYGYNIKPEFIKLERDRQTVSEWDLKRISKDMWFETEEFDVIAQMIEQDQPDIAYAEYSSVEMVRDACYKLFKVSHPDSVVAKTQSELKQLIKQGLERVVVIKDNYYNNVTASKKYKAQAKVQLETVKEQLEKWFSASKFHMHADVRKTFAAILKDSEQWRRM